MDTSVLGRQNTLSETKEQSVVIRVENLTKRYTGRKRQSFLALDHICFSVCKNEFLSIVGPSGCGKSTMLRILAGLEKPSEGEVFVNNKRVKGPGPDRGMVFQSYTLYPWLTVLDNIAFGLQMKGISKHERREMAAYYLKLIRLEDFADAYPHTLSGGMRQRVAIARALANQPEVLLMDEPFGALDPFTRESMQELLSEVWQRERTTVIFITHDIEEALFLSTRVLIMGAKPGRILKEMKIPWGQSNALVKESREFLEYKKMIVRLLQH